MIETIKEEEEQKLAYMDSNYQSNEQETKNKSQEDLESIKIILMKKIEELDKEFEVNFNKFV